MPGSIGQQHAREDLRDVLHMNEQAHLTLLGKMNGLAAGGARDELHVVGRATDLVGARDVGRADARDRHPVVPDVLAGLELVEDLVDRILARAVQRIVLGDQPLTEVTLLAAHRDRARVHDALDAAQAGRFEAVVHSEDVEAEHLVRIPLARPDAVCEVDDPVGLHLEDDAHDVFELRDVTTNDPDLIGEARERRRAGVEIHADDRLACRDQASDESWTDESRPADDQCRHARPPSAQDRRP